MAASTFAGQNVGAGKYDRVKKGMWVSTGMGVGYTIISGILLLMFAPQVIGVFSGKPDVVQYGIYVMKFFCPFYWLEQSGEQERHFRQWLYSLYPYVYVELSGFGRYFESTTNCLML